MARVLRAAGLLIAGFAAAVGALQYGRGMNRSAVQRGFEIAQRTGCFTCHGPSGMRGMANPGYGLDEIPPFANGMLAMYAQSDGEVREWIADGMPRRVRDDPEQMKLRKGALIAMPAFREVLSEREIDHLVAFVKAASDFEKPAIEAAVAGREVAEKLGCFNCHGPQGRGSIPNARSFKGYIPSWDGPDFAELVASDAEIEEWILDGASRRLRENPAARFFLERQVVRMPAYRGQLSEVEMRQLLDYIRWVRQNPY